MQIVEIREREGYRHRMANNGDLTQQDGWMTEDNRMTKNVALEWERTVSRDIFSSFCRPEPSSRPVAYRVSNFIQSLRLLLVTHMLSAINTPGTDFISGYRVLMADQRRKKARGRRKANSRQIYFKVERVISRRSLVHKVRKTVIFPERR